MKCFPSATPLLCKRCEPGDSIGGVRGEHLDVIGLAGSREQTNHGTEEGRAIRAYLSK